MTRDVRATRATRATRSPRASRSSRASRRTRATRAVAVVAAAGALLGTASAGYTVRSGDSLWAIAARNGTTVAALASANGISDPSRIYPGQVLELPGSSGGAAAPSPTSAAVLHVVQPGEYLSGIAARYGTTVRAILELNDIRDANRIRAGQQLSVPVSSSVAASTQEIGRDAAEALVERTARQHGWNPAFVKALAWQESGFQMGLVSSAGAIGIMQVMPETGRFVSTKLAGRTLDLTDPEDNVLAGVLFLDHVYDLTGGDARMTLGGYYQGLGSIRDNGMYPSTVQYIDNVLALKARFS